jgi:radical SAM protein with 4Fe4S-binding SPASM domain
MTLPRSLVWEVTGRCSLTCVHCYNVWSRRGCKVAELTPGARLRLVERLATHRRALKAITLSGGEPLLLSDLDQLVARLRHALPSAQINVATNGLLLTPRRAQTLRQAGASAVQLTLLSARPEVHDGLVGQQGAQMMVLAAFAAAKQAGLNVASFFVATRRNVEDLPGAAKLALALGADAVVFNRFQPGGRGLSRWRELTPTADQLARAAGQIRELRTRAPVPLGTPLPPCEAAGLEVLSCPIGTRNAYPCIGPDGDLRPCNHWPVAGGSLLERPLARLLRQPLFRHPPGERPSECQGCSWTRCRGGCPAARMLVGEAIYHYEVAQQTVTAQTAR